MALAKRLKSIPQIAETAQQLKHVQHAKRAFDKVKPALETLKASPTDGNANLAVGRFRVFYRGDWEQGVPYLALASDEAIRGPAEQELREPTESKDQLSLADAWWDLAQKAEGQERETMLLRAAMWYEMAPPIRRRGLQERSA